MSLEWSRDSRTRNSPWVGASIGMTYRIYPTHEFAIVRATLQRGREAEAPLGVFPTLDAATRHVNAHYADAGRTARLNLARQIREQREGAGDARNRQPEHDPSVR